MYIFAALSVKIKHGKNIIIHITLLIMQNLTDLKTASVLIIDPKALKEFAKSAIIEALTTFKEEENIGRLYNRHQAAKFLGLHFNTVKKYVELGLIHTNAAGKITHVDLLEFQKRRTPQAE